MREERTVLKVQTKLNYEQSKTFLLTKVVHCLTNSQGNYTKEVRISATVLKFKKTSPFAQSLFIETPCLIYSTGNQNSPINFEVKYLPLKGI